MMESKLVSEYDSAAFAVNGYKSIEEMYERLTPRKILHKIPVPMLTMVIIILSAFVV